MSDFKLKGGHFRVIYLIFTILLITGCVSALPEREMPIASDAVEDTASQNQIGNNEVVDIQEISDEISDHQDLIELQFLLSSGAPRRVENREPVVIDEISAHQDLLEVQFLLSGGNLGR